MQTKIRTDVAFFAGIWLLSLWTTSPGGESYDLRPSRMVGRLSRVDRLLEVAGSLKLPEAASIKTVPLQASGSATYEERLLTTATTASAAVRSIRHYEVATAKISVDGQTAQQHLSDNQKLIVADWSKERIALFCPVSRLSRDEVELITTPGDSVLLDALAPDQPVAIGDRWEYAPEVLAALVGIDAVDSHDVQSELKQVEGQAARCELAGTLRGAAAGVGTEIEVKAKFTIDVQARQVTWLALLLKESRSIGHASPGIEATSRLQVKVQPLTTPRGLPASLEGINCEPTPAALLLRYASAGRDFAFDYDRRWHLMHEDEKGAVFRLIDEGELIAQLNVLPLQKSASGQPIPLSKFQADIQQALGESFGQFVVASQNADDSARLVYRVVAIGKSQDLPIQWNYYLVTSPSGEQVLLIFTLESALVDRFGEMDQKIVDQLRFAAAAHQTASGPVHRR
jgi:hypothetical protein